MASPIVISSMYIRNRYIFGPKVSRNVGNAITEVPMIIIRYTFALAVNPATRGVKKKIRIGLILVKTSKYSETTVPRTRGPDNREG